ncbi:MAG: hypothetical protein KF802_02930 [Bdellovibrionaceae bacterium]|nr:hypothetical protein [Pseudobdellovibrionaceae bacterium]
MLKNIKFVGKIVSEPTKADGSVSFLLSFKRRCITESGDMELRSEVAEVVIKTPGTLKRDLIKGDRVQVQGDLSLTNKILNIWSTPVLTLSVDFANDLHFILIRDLVSIQI